MFLRNVNEILKTEPQAPMNVFWIPLVFLFIVIEVDCFRMWLPAFPPHPNSSRSKKVARASLCGQKMALMSSEPNITSCSHEVLRTRQVVSWTWQADYFYPRSALLSINGRVEEWNEIESTLRQPTSAANKRSDKFPEGPVRPWSLSTRWKAFFPFPTLTL